MLYLLFLVLALGQGLWSGRANARVLLSEQGAASRCPVSCTEYGTCNEELARCDCIKGKFGPDCSQDLSPEALEAMCSAQYYSSTSDCVRGRQACLNDCNNQGKCVAGFCKCNPGFYGADCSLSLGPDGKPQLLAAGANKYTTRAKKPSVYVYELPPEYTTWMNTKRLDRPMPLMFWQRLLSSGARTADGASADWYFIPIRARSHRDSEPLVKAIQYISRTWPWWNATNGHRHFAIHTGDLGIQEIKGFARDATANVTWLTHWGLHEDNDLSMWRAAHRIDKDVVIPVYISPHHFAKFGMERSPLHPKYQAPKPRNNMLFFAGRICGDRNDPDVNGTWPNCSEKSAGYSGGVRQRVHYHHHNRSGFVVVTRVKAYDQHLMRTKFCLAPPGGGHGQRQILVSFMGCLPVTIGDDIFQPFEPALDWGLFGVQPLEQQIPELHDLLESIPDAQLERMQRALKCAAQHFVYSSITGGFMGEDGRYDAFETMLELLRAKQRMPNAAPFEYVDLDPEFRRFMYCGADEMGGEANATALESLRQMAGRMGLQDYSSDVINLSVPGAPNPLCSHSRLDAHEPPCYRCMRGHSNTHGVPGGFACCNSDGDLTKCPRVWE